MARVVEPACRRLAGVGHGAAAADARSPTSAWSIRRARPATPATLRGHPTLVFFGFTHCPDVCPTTLALLASVQKTAWRCPGLKVALISVDPERDTPRAARQVHLVIRRRSYRPHGQPARDCEGARRASASPPAASISPAAATRWITRPRCSCSIPRRASSRCSRRRFSAEALDARSRAAGADARAAALMSDDSPGAGGPRLRRAPAPAAATWHFAPGARRDALALAGVQERADPPVRARLPARHVRRGGNRADRLRELQRILHARAARRHASRRRRPARHRLAGRRHRERSRHAQRGPPAAGQGPRLHAARAARRQCRAGSAPSPAAASRLSTWRPTTITASTWRWPANCARASTCRAGCSA